MCGVHLVCLFQVCCEENGVGKWTKSIGPLHPDCRHAEFENLHDGSFIVFLETCVGLCASLFHLCRLASILFHGIMCTF